VFYTVLPRYLTTLFRVLYDLLLNRNFLIVLSSSSYDDMTMMTMMMSDDAAAADDDDKADDVLTLHSDALCVHQQTSLHRRDSDSPSAPVKHTLSS